MRGGREKKKRRGALVALTKIVRHCATAAVTVTMTDEKNEEETEKKARMKSEE